MSGLPKTSTTHRNAVPSASVWTGTEQLYPWADPVSAALARKENEMTVADLIKTLNDFPGNAEIVTVRVLSAKRKLPEYIDNVFDGADFAGYDKDFAGKVVLW